MEHDTVYTHQGVTYVRDWYTGETVTMEEWKRAFNAQNEAWYTDPKNTAWIEAREKEKAKDAIRQKALAIKRMAHAEKQSQLLDQAKKIAATLTVTVSSYEDWRVANGYLWKVVSPKGTIYTETLKPLKIEDPLYVEGMALELAVKALRSKG